jgi:hypothetical protein
MLIRTLLQVCKKRGKPCSKTPLQVVVFWIPNVAGYRITTQRHNLEVSCLITTWCHNLEVSCLITTWCHNLEVSCLINTWCHNLEVSCLVTTWCHNPQDNDFNLHRCGNLKFGKSTAICINYLIKSLLCIKVKVRLSLCFF